MNNFYLVFYYVKNPKAIIIIMMINISSQEREGVSAHVNSPLSCNYVYECISLLLLSLAVFSLCDPHTLISKESRRVI